MDHRTSVLHFQIAALGDLAFPASPLLHYQLQKRLPNLTMESPALSFKRPIRSLIICFLGWKALLLLIAFASPGLGYDTSTNLIDWNHGGKLLTNSLEKLIRWDAIYYVEVASRGYKFEQEWAFGWGFTRVIALCTTGRMSIIHNEARG